MKILVVFGTRPEAIKLSPLIRKLRKKSEFVTRVCTTGQHNVLLDQVLELFELEPDYRLEIKNKNLNQFSGELIAGLGWVLEEEEPDLVVVHGDTMTTFCAAYAGFMGGRAVAHVEAGLRSGNMLSPWPEEANRVMVGQLASYHFCPTENAKLNLIDNNVKDCKIFVTGNTAIDAILEVRNKILANADEKSRIIKKINLSEGVKDYVLVTMHRRENQGAVMEEICDSLISLATEYGLNIYLTVHPNPRVKEMIYKKLNNIENIRLMNPLSYDEFVYLMMESRMILTDSGGIQEEGPALNKPVLVLREETERMEGCDSGVLKLVGTKKENIIKNTIEIYFDEAKYMEIINSHNPFGDGRACDRIIEHLIEIIKENGICHG